MSSLRNVFQNTAQKPLLMTHVVGGFPNLEESKEIVRMMDEVTDVIEIQIPFSDPVADGPTMQRCNELAIERGFHVDDAFQMARELSGEISTPLLFMTYYNIVYKRGADRFCQEAKEAGVQGLIVPDMPLEEEANEHFFYSCKKHDLAPIFVLSPLTTAERIQQLSDYAEGFWYAVSRTGTTGAQESFSTSIAEQAETIRSVSNLPVAFAFGVSKPEHLEQIGAVGDMAVVGSAVQNVFLQEKRPFAERLKEAKTFLLNLRTEKESRG